MSSSRDYLFCPLSGDLLEFDSANGVARCPMCSFMKDLSEFEGIKVTSETDMDDFRRRYGIKCLADAGADTGEVKRGRQTTDEDCVNCGHRGLEFYTMQLRSADEGQTVFYECPKCKHKWSQNN
ncbi:unnamed protein product [Pedinophyceae sp. YPF-701]|nr:unnamed protein product [Pedinophyceae sp. YPF-701]